MNSLRLFRITRTIAVMGFALVVAWAVLFFTGSIPREAQVFAQLGVALATGLAIVPSSIFLVALLMSVFKNEPEPAPLRPMNSSR